MKSICGLDCIYGRKIGEKERGEQFKGYVRSLCLTYNQFLDIVEIIKIINKTIKNVLFSGGV